MFYKIIEISRAADFDETYVLVHFWRTRQNMIDGELPILINDFVMQIRPTAVEAVRDNAGRYVTIDNTFYTPDELITLRRSKTPIKLKYTTRNTNVTSEIITNIENFIDQAKDNPLFVGDMMDLRIKRDYKDTRGIINRPDVDALRGFEKEKKVGNIKSASRRNS
jgi:hypothetical protein